MGFDLEESRGEVQGTQPCTFLLFIHLAIMPGISYNNSQNNLSTSIRCRMRYVILLIALFSLALSAHAAPIEVQWSEKNAPVLTPVESRYYHYPVYDFLIDDYDRDGKPEIAALRQHGDHPIVLSVRNYESTNYAQPMSRISYNGDFRKMALYALDHPRFKALMYCPRSDHATVLLFDHNMQPADSLKTIRGYDTTGTGEWIGDLDYPNIVDLNSDQRPDLLFRINTAGDGQPRALLGYDLLTKEKLLDVRFAPMTGVLQPIDFYNDGGTKLLLTLGGAGDGPHFGTFLRHESFLVLMQPDGTVIKSWEHPGNATYIQFVTADVTKDNCLDIIATFYSLNENSGLASSLKIIDGKSLELLDFYTSSTSASELNGLYLLRDSGELKILTSSEYGTFHLFAFNQGEKSLVLEHKLNVPGAQIGHVFTTDINMDGSDEIIFLSMNDPKIVILDAQFLTRAIIPFSDFKAPFRMQTVHNKLQSDPDIIFLSNGILQKATLPLHRLFPPSPVQIQFRDEIYGFDRSPVIIIFVTLMILIAGLLCFLTQRNSSLYSAWSTSARVAAVLVSKRGVIEWVNSVFVESFGFAASPKGQKFDTVLEDNELHPLSLFVDTFLQTDALVYRKDIQLERRGEWRAYAVELSRLRGGEYRCC